MTTQSLNDHIVHRLYDAAERLTADWRNAGLADDFGSRMIDATLRHLRTLSRSRRDGTTRDDQAQIRFAVALLRKFWVRNARRDSGRRKASQESGARPTVLPLDMVGESGPATALYDVTADDLCAGETGRCVAAYLCAERWPIPRAWAFVWRYSGREWEDVAFLLRERFGVDVRPDSLRQWQRWFNQAEPSVRQFLSAQ